VRIERTRIFGEYAKALGRSSSIFGCLEVKQTC